MKLQTFFLVFCTISLLFIEFNNGAPTKNVTTTTTTKPTKATAATKPAKALATTKPTKASPTAKPILVGGHTSWNTKIKAKYQKIFNDYKKITLKKLKEIHKVPDSFVPKADKFAIQVVGGWNYLYLVKLPINKYALVSIHDRPWKKEVYGKEENVHIRPQTYELNDKTV